MKLRIKGAVFDTVESRAQLINMLTGTIQGELGCEFIPYKVNHFDDMEWVVCRNNNWRVLFLQEPGMISIIYRYQCESVKAEEALASWLAFRACTTMV